MSQTASVSIKPPGNGEIWVPCGKCDRVTCHKVLTVVESNDQSPDGDIYVQDNYMTVQCQGCKTLSFCHESWCSENVDYDPKTGDMVEVPIRKVYPSRIAGRPEMEKVYLCPQGVYQIYKETHAALCNKLPILVGIGIRAIVEAVCKEETAEGSSLEKRIESLNSMGLITADGTKILHNLRFMGNEAAHTVKAHTEAELDTAFIVIEHLLKGVYIIPKKAGNLPQSKK